MKVLGAYLRETVESDDDNALLFRIKLAKSSSKLFGALLDGGDAVNSARSLIEPGGWGEGGGLERRVVNQIRSVLDRSDDSPPPSPQPMMEDDTTSSSPPPAVKEPLAIVAPVTPLPPPPTTLDSIVTPQITFKKTVPFTPLPTDSYLRLHDTLKSGTTSLSILRDSLLVLHDDLTRELGGDVEDDDVIDLDVEERIKELEEYERKVKHSKDLRLKLLGMLEASKCNFNKEGSSILHLASYGSLISALVRTREEVFDAMELEMVDGVEERRTKAETDKGDINKVLGSCGNGEEEEEEEEQKKKRRKV